MLIRINGSPLDDEELSREFGANIFDKTNVRGKSIIDRNLCSGLILKARKEQIGITIYGREPIYHYITRQDQSKPFSTSFYWSDEEFTECTMLEGLNRVLSDED